LAACLGGRCCATLDGACGTAADCCVEGPPCTLGFCCLANGTACAANDDCCSGGCSFQGCCLPSIFNEQNLRTPAEPDCVTDSDCCDGRCDGDICCRPAGEACTAGGECCSGSCDGGGCALTAVGAYPGQPSYCGATSDCPSGYVCRQHSCLGDIGADCGRSYDECLSGNCPWPFDAGCACSAPGAPCAGDASCCDGGRCDLGYCGVVQ